MSDWDYPFSEAEVEGWKKEHKNLSVVEYSDEYYVVRGIGREEYKGLDIQFKEEEEIEEILASRGTIYPEMSTVELRDKDAALCSTLSRQIRIATNEGKDEELAPFEIPEKLSSLPKNYNTLLKEAIDSETEDLTLDDLKLWRKQGRKLYIEELEGKLFIYRGLRRKDFDRWRKGQRNGQHQGNDSEDEVVKEGVLFPLKKDLALKGNDFLYGTISTLAVLVMAASGFNTEPSVTKL
jgi:hypothetical protein